MRPAWSGGGSVVGRGGWNAAEKVWRNARGRGRRRISRGRAFRRGVDRFVVDGGRLDGGPIARVGIADGGEVRRRRLIEDAGARPERWRAAEQAAEQPGRQRRAANRSEFH